MKRIVSLAAIAWAAFAIRAAATIQATAAVGAPIPAGRVLAVELANAAAWTIWAAVVVRLVSRSATSTGAARAGLLAGAALGAVLVVPALAGPVHAIFFSDGASLGDAVRHVLTHNVVFNLLIGVAMTSVESARHRNERMRELERTAARLAADLNRAQLDVLRAQLDPHFLFNALNSVTVLARRGRSEEVARMIEHLAGLLRYSLDSASTQVVPLRVELEALRHYVSIEEVRRGDRLLVRVDAPDSLSEVPVPSFLLQPLVENAIRHGTAPERPLTVEVVVARSPNALRFTITDDGDGADASNVTDGVGLGNTRARLAGLYGEKASLTLRPGAAGRGTVVEVVLPAGTEEAPV